MTAQGQVVEPERVDGTLAEAGSPYASLRGWLESRTELWRRFDEAATPAEQRTVLAQLRQSRQRFEEETRRLGA